MCIILIQFENKEAEGIYCFICDASSSSHRTEEYSL